MQLIDGIIVDLDGGGGRLEFRLNPAEVNDDKAVNWEAVEVMGFSDPRFQFNNSGERTISFTLKLLVQTEERTYVRNTVNWLRSLEYPAYEGAGDRKPPPRVQFIFGDMYDLTCVVRAINVRHLNFDPQSLLPVESEVDILLAQWIRECLTPEDIRT